MKAPEFLRRSTRRGSVTLHIVKYAPESKSTQPAAPSAPTRSTPPRASTPTPRVSVTPPRDPYAMVPQKLTWFLFFLIVVIAVCSIALTACAPKPPKAVKARAQLVVSADVNPDTAGRASPVVVRLFQLRNDGEFAAADFFALYEKEKETLGASLISREEYVLAPGETRTLEMPINPDARFVGAVAAYRDIRSAHWRALTRTPEKKLTDLLGKHGLTLSVGKDTVTLAVED
jgi:type VI secretion system protein VasD